MVTVVRTGACSVAFPLLLLTGCGATAAHDSAAPLVAPSPATKDATTQPDVQTIPLPTPGTSLKQLSDEQAAPDLSLRWHLQGNLVAGRSFTATIDIPSCVHLHGVHFTVDGDSAEVAMLGAKDSGTCTAQRTVAVTRVAWPATISPHATITHAPTSS